MASFSRTAEKMLFSLLLKIYCPGLEVRRFLSDSLFGSVNLLSTFVQYHPVLFTVILVLVLKCGIVRLLVLYLSTIMATLGIFLSIVLVVESFFFYTHKCACMYSLFLDFGRICPDSIDQMGRTDISTVSLPI